MIHIHIYWGDIYGYIPLHSSHAGLKWHVPCMLAILVYHWDKQTSNVILSIHFDTNVSQLLRHVLPWSYDPLPFLGELSSSSLNRLSVCLCVSFVCVSHQWCTVVLYCVSSVPSGPVFKGKKGGFFIFLKKMGKFFFSKGVRRHPHPTWRPDVRCDNATQKCTVPLPSDGLLCKSKCGNLLVKTTVLRINLNLDGVSIASKSHTHPSHSKTSRLLTSSLSLGVPVPRPTQCLRDV